MTPIRSTVNSFRRQAIRPFCSKPPSSSKDDGDVSLNRKRMELLSILSRSVEKKAETLLNLPKCPDTPWRAYDLAVRVELDQLRSKGHAVPRHVSDSIVRGVIKIDIESQRDRLRHYKKVRDREQLADEILLHKLEKQERVHREFVRRIARERPEFMGLKKDEFHTAEGYHVLGPRLCLDGAFTMTRADSMAQGNLLHARQFGQPFVIGTRDKHGVQIGQKL